MSTIAVDASVWMNKRGYGRHARALLNALVASDADRRYVFVMDQTPDVYSIPDRVTIRQVRTSEPTVIAASAESRRSIGDIIKMGRALSDKVFDLVLFPTIYSYVPTWGRARKVMVIHDIIPEVFPELTLPNRSTKFFWKLKSAMARQQADVIVTVSHYSKNLLTKHFNLDPYLVEVVGEAPDPIFYPRSDLLPLTHNTDLMEISSKRYLIYVGGFGPHKNIETLVHAFAKIIKKPSFGDLYLVLVGEYRKEVFFSTFKTLSQQIYQNHLDDRVLFTGYLSDEELACLLSRAQGLVLPSLMEGYGLPAIEAAACGCPVIATRESPLPDLLRDSGIYFDPLNLDQLECALVKILESDELRKRMGNAGVQVAAGLTWQAAAAQMKSVIDRLLIS